MTLMQILQAEDLFDRLEPETPQRKDNHIEVYVNPRVAWLLKAHKETVRVLGLPSQSSIVESSHYVLNTAPFPLTAQDIEYFSLSLDHSTSDDFMSSIYTGIFLTECVQRCVEDRITIHTHHIGDLRCLGYGNQNKHIVIEGNAGDEVAKEMLSGIVEVKGNVNGQSGALMRGGELIVRGDALGSDLCNNMFGGIVRIYGNVKDFGVNWNMRGGEIYIEGECLDLSKKIDPLCKGRIYHKGKLIAGRTLL